MCIRDRGKRDRLGEQGRDGGRGGERPGDGGAAGRHGHHRPHGQRAVSYTHLDVYKRQIQGLTVSAASSWIGIVMHILATGSFCVLAGLIYRRRHTRGGAALALAVGTLTQTLVMVGCNLVFTPLFMGAPVGEVVAMLVPAIIPFNLMKAALNSLVTFVIYKPISRVVRIEGEPLTAAPKCQEK